MTIAAPLLGGLKVKLSHIQGSLGGHCGNDDGEETNEQGDAHDGGLGSVLDGVRQGLDELDLDGEYGGGKPDGADGEGKGYDGNDNEDGDNGIAVPIVDELFDEADEGFLRGLLGNSDCEDVLESLFEALGLSVEEGSEDKDWNLEGVEDLDGLTRALGVSVEELVDGLRAVDVDAGGKMWSDWD